ncbi:MAG TPA: aldehyde dehydrogenase family protein [Candidatus Limnocylindrales bacterium]|nr:aldehyde dehydrogenase family protein [Candidatus Limnocylindrales bacterium]
MSDPRSVAVREIAPRIEGRSSAPTEWLEFSDPYTGQPVSRVARSGPEVVEEAVQAARLAQPRIAAMPVAERAAILRRAADLIEERADGLAVTISREIGKALKNTRREVRRSSATLRAAATAAESLHGTIPDASVSAEGAGLLALAMRVPVGVVAAITPFNAPFNLVAHKIAPSFAAGNATIVKPASQTAATALDLIGILEEAGAPAGAFTLVPGDRDTVRALASHPGIDLFSLTGGRAAAQALSSLAGTRRVLQELGGNSPNIVHDDADLAVAVREVASGGFSNSGQSCNSVQRVYVHRRIADDFSARLVDAVGQLRCGDPLDQATDVGTLVDAAAAVRIEGWIAAAVNGGARVLAGGHRIGAAIEPTVIADAADDSQLVCDEVFGPVVAILPYDSLDEAIRRANASAFGLMAAIFTSSLGPAMQAARDLQTGGVVVNRSTNFRLDHLPYGGVKDSGSGREGPAWAVEELTTIKLVLIDPLVSRPPNAG